MDKYALFLGSEWVLERIAPKISNEIISHSSFLAEYDKDEHGFFWLRDLKAPTTEEIKNYEKGTEFLGVNEFDVYKLEYRKEPLKIEEFEGTFIDAFKYINQNFGRI